VITVVDYGMGNVGSIMNMLKKIGACARASQTPHDLLDADKLILPGVGAFDAGMTNLRARGYLPVLHRRVIEEKTPILGICLGMQLFCERSEEGQERGLGWIEGRVVRFRFDGLAEQPRVPHMGWDEVAFRPGTLFAELNAMNPRFYFVHSYHVRCAHHEQVLAESHYGLDFTSAVLQGNILGTQFHPEKSHRYGMEFFRRFLDFC